MPTRKPHKRKLDRVDAEAIREMLQTRGWKLYTMRIEKMRAAKRAELEQTQPENTTATIRGFLDAVTSIAAIPGILFREGSRSDGTPDD